MEQPHATPQPEKVHLAYLDGLRALAAVWVVLFHCILIVGRDAVPTSGPLHTVLGQLMLGHEAVNLFIVLSGFCLMLPVARGNGTLPGGALAFYKRRAWRILPPYYAAIALSLILIATCLGERTGNAWDRCVGVTPAGVLAHLLLIHEWFPRLNPQIDGPLWSVAVEWKIYFLFPVLVLAWQRFGAVRTTLGALLLGNLVFLALHRTPVDLSLTGASPHYLGLFALGMLACGIVFSNEPGFVAVRTRLPWIWMAPAAFINHRLVLKASYRMDPPVDTLVSDNAYGLFAVVLLVALAQGKNNPARQVLASRPLAGVGTFSYSIYLIHFPVIQLVWQHGLRGLHLSPFQTLVLLMTLGTAATLLASYLFYRAFEAPFARGASRRWATGVGAAQSGAEPVGKKKASTESA